MTKAMKRSIGIGFRDIAFRMLPSRPIGSTPQPGPLEMMGAAERIGIMLDMASDRFSQDGLRPKQSHPRRPDCHVLSVGNVEAALACSDEDMDMHLEFHGEKGMSVDIPFIIGTNGIRRFRSVVILGKAAIDGLADQNRAEKAHRLLLRKAAIAIGEGAGEARFEAPLPWSRDADPELLPALDVMLEPRCSIPRISITRMKVTLRRDEIDPVELMKLIAERID